VAEAGTCDVDAAARALDEAARFVEADDHVGLSLANRGFHRGLYSSCANSLVVSSLDDLQDLTALATVSLLWEQWPTMRTELAEHREILDAVRARQPERAEELLRRHIERSIERLTSGDAGRPAES
jgi:DNA-binding GntR family transcriptional regulator